DKNRFSSAIEEAYVQGLNSQEQLDVKRIHLADLAFDPILRHGYTKRTPLEPDLKKAMETLMTADHVVWIFPTWWGGPPALLKGFIDRTFLPGFFFSYHENDPFWDKHMKGKTARIITTMDSPRWFYRLAYGRPGYHMMKRITLQFVGFKTRYTAFGGVKDSSPAQRSKWLEKVSRLATRDVRKMPNVHTGHPAGAKVLAPSA
ncbi:MAG: NAD(P)H-dependent oxidoreductase, partial [Bacteroidota bacterium]